MKKFLNSKPKFYNLSAPNTKINFKELIALQKEFILGKQQRIPKNNLPLIKLNNESFNEYSKKGLRLTWLGHSSVLIEIEGYVILTDPMFSKKISPFPIFSPVRFHKEFPISPEDLPKIDLVIISHDHYDHLDFKTIKSIHKNASHFYVPIGLAKYLKTWGVSAAKITEFSWWEEVNLDKNLKIISTPSQHFSGRGLINRNTTLWSSWVIIAENHRLYFSGDTGYFPELKTIGDKYGPFDITMIEMAQYSKYWPYVHMIPEQSLQAHQDLKGKVLLPIHWGTFSLSIHEWTEPIERLIKEANKLNLLVATPKVGESIIGGENITTTFWWRD